PVATRKSNGGRMSQGKPTPREVADALRVLSATGRYSVKDDMTGESDMDVILNEAAAAAAREHIDDVFGNLASLPHTDRKFRLLEGGVSADEPPAGPK
ncbi:hypothetical protein, partial [Mycobacteroides abscessus]|uniref:hypothetical protein n=1 Tax=Mycobacteroides abscessus TaxID=36809 RepID=UPI001A99FAAF